LATQVAQFSTGLSARHIYFWMPARVPVSADVNLGLESLAPVASDVRQ
jgi:hypothetical protein